MQWLIDIIKEWIVAEGYALQSWVQAQGYLTAGFVDRGDPAAVDFNEAALISDSTWRDLDLSSIVPEHAKGVVFTFYGAATGSAYTAKFRTKGNVNEFNISRCVTVVGSIAAGYNCTVPLDNDRFIQYWLETATWPWKRITVKGWWF